MKRWLIIALLLLYPIALMSGKEDRLTLDLGRYGTHKINLSKPMFEGNIEWSSNPQVGSLHLWLIVPCECGVTHLILIVPQKGGGKMKAWMIDQRSIMEGFAEDR